MMIGVKGKQLCAGNPNADDSHGDSSIPPPPNFVGGWGGGGGGINILLL